MNNLPQHIVNQIYMYIWLMNSKTTHSHLMYECLARHIDSVLCNTDNLCDVDYWVEPDGLYTNLDLDAPSTTPKIYWTIYTWCNDHDKMIKDCTKSSSNQVIIKFMN